MTGINQTAFENMIDSGKTKFDELSTK